MLMLKAVVFLSVIALVREYDAARILAYYPTPSISHQVVFRPLTLELVKRGHEVVVITTDPIYPKGDGPANLTEIDCHDLSYKTWRQMLAKMKNTFNRNDFEMFINLIVHLVEEQMNTTQVQELLKDKSKTFDLVIVEAFIELALGLAHHYKAPVIQFSSLAAGLTTLNIFGASVHPFLYPTPTHERLYNLTIWEKLQELYHDYRSEQMIPENLEVFDAALKRIFGPDVPPFEELRTNVDLLFLNVHPIWDSNRPVPPNVIYLGGLHQKPQKDLPEDLKTYLDSSKNGVIYVSFGTNVDPGLFFPEKIQTLVNVFSKLPYDVLWKWNQDELPGRTENIRISKWLPQSDLLRHPKLKLFITQGGLQSTDEAITAGVPLIGLPVFGDQKYNVEQYLYFGIGERVDIDTITEEELSGAINKILGDNSYRSNVAKLRAIMADEPRPALERAAWWAEYVVRRGGARQLRARGAAVSLPRYLELRLALALLAAAALAAAALLACTCCLWKACRGKVKNKRE